MRAIIFDLDNTLYPYTPCDNAGRDSLYAYLNPICPMPREEFAKLYIDCDAETKRLNPLTAAGHNRILFYHHMCEVLGIPGDVYDIPMYNAYWDAYLNAMQIFPGALELLQKLKVKKIPLGICSDLTLHIQIRKLQKLGLIGIFDKITVSEEVGADKPAAIMFTSIAQKLGAAPKDCMMIGDNYKRDILGARAVGMQTILYGETREDTPSAKDFTELSLLLKQSLRGATP